MRGIVYSKILTAIPSKSCQGINPSVKLNHFSVQMHGKPLPEDRVANHLQNRSRQVITTPFSRVYVSILPADFPFSRA